jgi:hypothetical protein
MIEKFLQSRDDADVMKGIVAGVAGGLLASLVMEQFQFVWNKTAEAIRRASQEEKPKGRKLEPVNVKAAQLISKNVFGKRLPKSRKKLAGEAVHYAMGTASAAIYGALAEASPATTLGDGFRERGLVARGRGLRAGARFIEGADKDSILNASLHVCLPSRLWMDDRNGTARCAQGIVNDGGPIWHRTNCCTHPEHARNCIWRELAARA